MEAREQGGFQPGDPVYWKPLRTKDTVQRSRKYSTGRFVGFEGNHVRVEYDISMGRGAVKTKQLLLDPSRLLDREETLEKKPPLRDTQTAEASC